MVNLCLGISFWAMQEQFSPFVEVRGRVVTVGWVVGSIPMRLMQQLQWCRDMQCFAMPCHKAQAAKVLEPNVFRYLGGAYELALVGQLLCKAGNVRLIRQGPDFEPAVHRGHHEVDHAFL